MATIVTEEDEMMHNGEALPILSASAKKMRIDKLLAAPLPTYTSSVPGSFFWTNVAFWMCRRVSSVQFRTVSSTSTRTLQRDGAGAMCCGWHTNGLMDPLGIFLRHPKEFVVGARHDLVTRPLLGWWTRRLAVQPVVRKAELLRGGCTEEEAQHLNGRSLLALANGIAHGFGCVLFPEGTSHDNSHMIRFKTGPVRTVLAAAALAKANNLPLPHLVPVGLHFRRREHFRTDQYVEFGDPIVLEDSMVSDAMVNAVREGGWVEPSAETVHDIRDRLQTILPDMTPNAATWEEHRAVHLVAHLNARSDGTPLDTWQKEVHAARTVRDSWPGRTTSFPPEPLAGERYDKASEAAEILEHHGLDGRDLNQQGTGLRRANPLRAPIALAQMLLFLAFLPVSTTSLGLQITLGRLLGDSTDEGLDARTSYQFLAAFFGSLLVWPIIALLWTTVLWLNQAPIADMTGLPSTWLSAAGGPIVVYFLCFPLFWASGKTFAWAWDAWVDARKAWKRRFLNSEERNRLQTLLRELC
ncbi:MAG: 1-acyl-sn-glycerol-3-phosphate acyltransferase [Candidatus Poseidonia sp.]|nr:1-acyl-sn-glycerol-3-phosphate acyltransferase [Poseidonia sp.]